jgi:murein DD-endopeptidase MepM/ murein hydrolase activator NlpD
VETPVTDTTPFELLEPIAPMTTTFADAADETVPAPEASSSVDAFEAAARLFSFTGETPIQQPAAESVADQAHESETAEPAAHDVPRGRKPRARRTPRRTGASFKRVAAASFSVSAMAIVGLLAVGMTTPAVAVASSSPAGDVALKTEAPAGDVVVDPEEIQAYVAPAQVQNVELDRDAGGYETASLRDLAASEGVTTFSSFFTNDPTAAIQWPFAVGVPMTFGFGPRWGAMHTGIDLTPGNGSEIHAIADGVVRSASDATGGYGVNIYINHIIDGKLVTSHYAHMQYGSMRVKAGDHVKVGQVIGLVGNTGHSFGAHLHFEILLNGTQLVDPLPWMRKNAGRASLGD